MVLQSSQEAPIKRLLVLLKEDLESVESNDPEYTNPAWAYQMAHAAGRRQAYRDIINLLETQETPK